MQYLKYPAKVMGISQNYNGSLSHKNASNGNIKAYPIDDACGTKGRSYFYAPCDVIIRRIYGVGNKGTNTIWMESKNKIKLANGKESYVTILVTHPEDDDLSKIKVGQTFKQGTKMFREGKDGFATGYHFHIEVAACKFSKLKNKGWVKNNKNAWVISNDSIKPEQAFFVDKEFTKIEESKGLKFIELPKIEKVEVAEDTNNQENTIYYSKYTGKSKSLVDALKELKIDSSFSNRKKIAKANNIKNYLGTSAQNNKLLDLLYKSKLIKP